MQRQKTIDMTNDYSTEESENTMVSEPSAGYGATAKRRLRVITKEEMSRCMTLEESERLITEKIYRFYHSEI